MANVQSSTLISSMFTQNCCLALNTIQAMRNCDKGTAQNLYASIKPNLSRELKTVKRSAGRGGKPQVVFCTLQEATAVLQSLPRETKPDSMADEREKAIMGMLGDFFKQQVTYTVCPLT